MITAFSPINYNYKRYSAQTTPFGGRKPDVKIGKTLEDFARELASGSGQKELPKEAYPQLPLKNIEKIHLSVSSSDEIQGNQRIVRVHVQQKPQWGESEGSTTSTKLMIGTINEIQGALRTTPFTEKIKVAVEKLARDPGQN